MGTNRGYTGYRYSLLYCILTTDYDANNNEDIFIFKKDFSDFLFHVGRRRRRLDEPDEVTLQVVWIVITQVVRVRSKPLLQGTLLQLGLARLGFTASKSERLSFFKVLQSS